MDQVSSDFALERNIRAVRSCHDPAALQGLAITLLQTNSALKELLADSMLKEVESRRNSHFSSHPELSA
jgi:hypothetical protein